MKIHIAVIIMLFADFACLTSPSRLTTLGLSLRAQAEEAPPATPKPSAEYIICRNKKAVRTVRVEKDPNSVRCITIYTRNGVDKEVAHGLNHGSCVKIMGNIRINLEKANWSCKEVASVSSTTSSASK